MGAALNATGRHIHYAMCSWGVGDPWLGWGSEVGTPGLHKQVASSRVSSSLGLLCTTLSNSTGPHDACFWGQKLHNTY